MVSLPCFHIIISNQGRVLSKVMIIFHIITYR